MTRADRFEAILAIAARGRMKKLEVADLEALCELADEPPSTSLGEMLRPAEK